MTVGGLGDLQAVVADAHLTVTVTAPAEHVALVTIDRPEKANSIDDETHYGLTTLWQQIERRGDIRAIGLTGRGLVFSGGGDRSHWPSLIDDRHYRRNKMSQARAIVVNMLRCELPIIAAVNGPAVGLGCSLALAAEASSFDTEYYRDRVRYPGSGEATAVADGPDAVPDWQVRQWARSRPEAVAIADGRRSLSYAEVDRLVDGLAGTFAAAGVGLGDVVTVWSPAWWQASVAFLAAHRVGAIAHPMSDVLGPAEAAEILERVKPGAVVCGSNDPAAEERVAAIAAEAAGSVVLRARDLRERAPGGPPEVAPDPDRVSALIFTSGTTSAPKAVRHTHRSLGVTVRDVGERVGIRSGDVIGVASPIGHVRWVIFGAILPFLFGGSLFTCARWRPAEWAVQADEAGCRFAAFSPKHLEDLVAQAEEGRRCPALEVVTCGGSFLSTQQLRRAEEVLGITVLRSYGCTEFPSAVGGGVDDPPEQRWQYDGRPLSGVEVRLEQGGDDEVVRLGGSGPMGRICMRGAHAAVGVTDPDGWYRTEDFGELVDGWLRVLGRSADIIIRNGENISANEVEGVLSGFPGLGEFAVVGRQDPVAGERVCLVVVGAPGGTVPTVTDLAEFLEGSGVMKQKWPESVVDVDGLPRTSNGKLVRRRLWELVNDGGRQG